MLFLFSLFQKSATEAAVEREILSAFSCQELPALKLINMVFFSPTFCYRNEECTEMNRQAAHILYITQPQISV